MKACLTDQYIPGEDTEGTPHADHCFSIPKLQPAIAGVFVVMPQGSSLSAARATTSCSIRQRICATKYCS